MKYNFAFIPTKDFLTLKSLKMHFGFFSAFIKTLCIRPEKDRVHIKGL